MRIWQFFQFLGQEYPPRLIEVLMLSLAMILLLIWGYTDQWPYLVLSLSYVIGSSVSVLIRESFYGLNQLRLTQIAALVLLILSLYSFTDLSRYW